MTILKISLKYSIYLKSFTCVQIPIQMAKRELIKRANPHPSKKEKEKRKNHLYFSPILSTNLFGEIVEEM